MSNTPGWKTTEFWGTHIAQALSIWGTVAGVVPPQIAVPVSALLQIAYIVARTWLKKDLPAQ